MPLLEFTDLSKTFDSPAVDHISLSIEAGQIFCLLGPSGCGKTTLLRLVAGLERPDSGRVWLNGADITDRPPHKRQIGMMFQEFALFPHKSVFENVAFGLRMQRKTPDKIRQRTRDLLSLVGLSEHAGRNVADLSGGERQRVALARSLAPRPKLLMLDEPLGALDRALRERLLADIHTILKTLGMTAVFVTHDQTEALTVGDRVAVMHQGRFMQVDSPELLYLQPKSVFVAEFLGYKNLIAGAVSENGGVQTGLGTLFPSSGIPAPGAPVTLVVPNDAVHILEERGFSDDGDGTIRGRVVARLFTGQNYRITIAVENFGRIVADLPNQQAPQGVGDHVVARLDPAKTIVIPNG